MNKKEVSLVGALSSGLWALALALLVVAWTVDLPYLGLLSLIVTAGAAVLTVRTMVDRLEEHVRDQLTIVAGAGVTSGAVPMRRR